MAEVQKTTVSGETTQKFIQFIMMQQQQALLALGRYPNPPPGLPPSNLGLARVFIDQLSMIRVKTAGNLNGDEQHLLNSVLTSLEEAYQELIQGEA
ncbi:MAG: hypothetical protein JWL59_2871 [Chthoniobacteraceae bacterium]|nr:hypothetical protein [Chthoniobacteraceae bacterium]